jgi:2-keto-4-pentenoate hydratase/2-oxohepta-3-ene-1,7-dioic acid hydratase in catechol pathway
MLARAQTPAGPAWGRVEGDRFQPVRGAEAWPQDLDAAGAAVDIEGLAWLPPVRPSKIVCVGRNYREHARELGNEVPAEPLIFLKPPSALLAHGAEVRWPAACERLDFEGELAVVVGRRLRAAGRDEAAAAVAGVAPMLDMTARDIQRREGAFTRAKGFDTFAPVGPCVGLGPLPEGELRLRTWVDGDLRQDGSSAQMVFGIPELLSFISGVMTLEPGDLVATGTPPGVGPVQPGQEITLEVEGLPPLRVRIGERDDAT